MTAGTSSGQQFQLFPVVQHHLKLVDTGKIKFFGIIHTFQQAYRLANTRFTQFDGFTYPGNTKGIGTDQRLRNLTGAMTISIRLNNSHHLAGGRSLFCLVKIVPDGIKVNDCCGLSATHIYI